MWSLRFALFKGCSSKTYWNRKTARKVDECTVIPRWFDWNWAKASFANCHRNFWFYINKLPFKIAWCRSKRLILYFSDTMKVYLPLFPCQNSFTSSQLKVTLAFSHIHLHRRKRTYALLFFYISEKCFISPVYLGSHTCSMWVLPTTTLFGAQVSSTPLLIATLLTNPVGGRASNWSKAIHEFRANFSTRKF